MGGHTGYRVTRMELTRPGMESLKEVSKFPCFLRLRSINLSDFLIVSVMAEFLNWQINLLELDYCFVGVANLI